MKRTQLYLDDDSWQALRIASEQTEASISELVRRAVREKYSAGPAARAEAMRAFVGVWANRTGMGNSTDYVRGLRRGHRLKRLAR